MAAIKRFIKKTNIKTRAISILVAVTILAGSFVWFGNNNMDNVSAEGSEKAYMEYIVDRIINGLQEDFKILEIVPYTGFGEFRYYLDEPKVRESLEAQQDKLSGWYWSGNAWQTLQDGGFSNFGYEIRKNSDTGLYEIRSKNAFLNNVLGDYSGLLADRIHLDTVEANDLTAELIEQADLIIYSTKNHDNGTLSCYESWTGITGNVFYTSTGDVSSDKYYNTYEKVTDEAGNVTYVSRDAEWAMCEELLECTINGRELTLSDGTTVTVKTPIVLDNGQTYEINKDTNLFKFAMIYRTLAGVENIDNDSYVNPAELYEVLKQYLSTTYTAADGTEKQYISESNGLVTVALDITATGTFDETTPISFGDAGGSVLNSFYDIYDGGKYKDAIVTNCFEGKYQTWLTDNFVVYPGTQLLIPANMSSPSDYGNNPGFTGRTGSSTTAEGIIQYLLGAKSSQIKRYDYTMRVLEVEPCNSFDYDTFDEVKELGKRLLMAGADSWTEENYKNYLQVDCVTTNALNGMTDDLNAKYDMIIIGENIELLTKDGDGNTIYNDRNLNGYKYLAYGDLFKVGSNYLGILPSEYEELKVGTQYFSDVSASHDYLWTDYVFNSFMEAGLNGKVLVSKNMYEYYRKGGAYGKYDYNDSTGEFYLSYSLGNVRGADNDVTDITKDKLLKFAEAGKIIVLSDSLYDMDKTTVYPTSDIYDLSETLAIKDESGHRVYSVIRQKYISGAVAYLSNEVPQITMLEAPAAPEYVNGVISTFGSRDLRYRFTLKGQVGKTYKINLYVDKNSDGVFKGIEAGISDDSNELYYSERITLNGGNATEYTIKSRLSDNFVGMLSWKIEVIQLDGAGHETALATSEKGYSAIKNETSKDIRVLQILPPHSVTLNLATNDPTKANDFQDLLQAVEEQVGYNIIIDTMKVSQYEALFKPNASGDNSYEKGVDINTEKDKLKSYDMVVIGFADMYNSQDINNKYGALDNILDFIEIGKSVLFTHDTLSWRATPNYVTAMPDGSKHIEMQESGKINAGAAWQPGGNQNFAYQLTIGLRNIVGLDKYGITLTEDNRDGKEAPVYSNSLSAPNYTSASADGKYYVEELQGFNTWNIYRGLFTIDYSEKYGRAGSGLYTLVPYTNTEFIYNDSDGLWTTKKVIQLNEGPVTMYPYSIDEKLTVAETHAQYYELDMEDEDIVVWYTLSDDGTAGAGYYECTEKDAGNNYYIYSKNNITYSGAGHSTMNSEAELRLFVNTIVKAIAGGNSAPELMITNGSVGSGGIYMVYTDSTITGGDYQLDIKATDADLISYEAANGNLDLVGKFKEAYVYWVKPDGTEVLIKSYTESNPLRNGIVSELRLGDTSLSSEQLAQIESLVEETENGYAQFRIEVSDWKGAKDEIYARIVQKNLFNLE